MVKNTALYDPTHDVQRFGRNMMLALAEYNKTTNVNVLIVDMKRCRSYDCKNTFSRMSLQRFKQMRPSI